MRITTIIGVIFFMLVSCATANENAAKDVSFRTGLLEKIGGEFVVAKETSVIRRLDVVGGLGFGVLLSAASDFEFVAEVTFPKTEFRGSHVSAIHFGDDDNISVKMKRRTKNGYGYVNVKLDEGDPSGAYVVTIYAEDIVIFRALFDVVE